METIIRSVESCWPPNNFLTYTVHDSERPLRSHQPRVDTHISFVMWLMFFLQCTFFFFHFIRNLYRLTLSHTHTKRKYTSVSGDKLCILLRGLQWMCANDLCKECFASVNQHNYLTPFYWIEPNVVLSPSAPQGLIITWQLDSIV